jgi:hypothetical protein
VEVGPPLDLARPASVRAFARCLLEAERPLHVLVNNAGANYLPNTLTTDGVPLLTQVPRRVYVERGMVYMGSGVPKHPCGKCTANLQGMAGREEGRPCQCCGAPDSVCLE